MPIGILYWVEFQAKKIRRHAKCRLKVLSVSDYFFCDLIRTMLSLDYVRNVFIKPFIRTTCCAKIWKDTISMFIIKICLSRLKATYFLVPLIFISFFPTTRILTDILYHFILFNLSCCFLSCLFVFIASTTIKTKAPRNKIFISKGISKINSIISNPHNNCH